VRGTTCAIKIPNKQTLTEDERAALDQEVAAMRRVFHPNVVLFLGGCVNPGEGEKIALAMELVATDLKELLEKDRNLLQDSRSQSGRLTANQRFLLIQGAASGMAWLHGMKLCHRE
jgi:serine/threonine protein kinase